MASYKSEVEIAENGEHFVVSWKGINESTKEDFHFSLNKEFTSRSSAEHYSNALKRVLGFGMNPTDRPRVIQAVKRDLVGGFGKGKGKSKAATSEQ